MIFGPGPKIQEAVPSSKGMGTLISTSIIGLVVEFVVAIDEARVRFTDDALLFLLFFIFAYIYCWWNIYILYSFLSFFFYMNSLIFQGYYVMFYTLQVLTKSGNSLIPRYQSSIYITRNIKYTSTQLTSIMIMINSKHEYIPHI
ncbi:hypothetical protein ACN42_g1273 [Penicillium freii]|uniref:Uncharacterized protein n=1 Tax=Penicillium freii TaxID=48697 RepID=A0A117NRM3_PENFR|nr:hypothetical protein ACN42_g1273 [Penicillium freii]